VEFRLLGPVELWADGHLREFGSSKERHVLAILLVSAGQLVSIDTMIDHLWDDRLPPKPRASIYSYINRLRGRLEGAGTIVSRPGGYVLDVDPELIDLHRFWRLNDQARAIADSGDVAEALRLFREAEQLWRGEPLSGLPGRWAADFRTSLENNRHSGMSRRLALELDDGRHEDLVGELYGLVARYPYDETFVGYLMRALYGAGRQGDALEAYHQARRRLSDDHGTLPAQPLRDLHERILREDPTLIARRPGRPAHAPLGDNLPRDTPDFTGREAELGRLYAALDPTPTAITIVPIDGMAGVGKTALAIHVGHRLAERYPDGRLYLKLHAHDPNGPPIDPADGLETLLRDIGEDPKQIPATLEQRAARWRTRLAKRRLLVILDDATSQDQVRPFLPGAADCLVLITSRRRLIGLDGVRPLSLDVLRPQEAVRLFCQIAGDGRPLDAAAVARVVRLCGYHPLSISIAANQLRHRPARSVRDLAAKLSRDRLAGGNLSNVFGSSYRELSEERRRAFRRLGLYVGADFTADAAAALIGCDRAEAERALEELIDHHLVEEPQSGRVRLHDLLRDYARERVADEESEEEPRRAVRRLLDFYLYTADQADRTLYPYRRRDWLEGLSDPVAPPPLDSQGAADWLRTERANLLSCVSYAAEHGFAAHAVQLSRVLATDLERSACWDDAARVHEIAREACHETGDRRAAARAGLELSLVHSLTGHYDAAFDRAQEAMDVFGALDDRQGMADTFDQMARIAWFSGRNRSALGYAEEALAIYRPMGERHGLASALLHKGIALAYLGRATDAIAVFEESLKVARRAEDPALEAMILNNLGDINIKRGYHRDALRLFRETLTIMRKIGWRQNEAVALNNIADVHRYKGHYDEALHFYREALSVYGETGDRRNEANALNNIGMTYVDREGYAEALIHFQKALRIGKELGDPLEHARALYGIARVQSGHGRYAVARETYKRALTMGHTAADSHVEACSLQGLGEIALEADDREETRKLWRRALRLFERLGVPEAEILLVRLQALDETDC
jgi:DNA-binding SARP family transcriptional activator